MEQQDFLSNLNLNDDLSQDIFSSFEQSLYSPYPQTAEDSPAFPNANINTNINVNQNINTNSYDQPFLTLDHDNNNVEDDLFNQQTFEVLNDDYKPKQKIPFKKWIVFLDEREKQRKINPNLKDYSNLDLIIEYLEQYTIGGHDETRDDPLFQNFIPASMLLEIWKGIRDSVSSFPDDKNRFFMVPAHWYKYVKKITERKQRAEDEEDGKKTQKTIDPRQFFYLRFVFPGINVPRKLMNQVFSTSENNTSKIQMFFVICISEESPVYQKVQVPVDPNDSSKGYYIKNEWTSIESFFNECLCNEDVQKAYHIEGLVNNDTLSTEKKFKHLLGYDAELKSLAKPYFNLDKYLFLPFFRNGILSNGAPSTSAIMDFLSKLFAQNGQIFFEHFNRPNPPKSDMTLSQLLAQKGKDHCDLYKTKNISNRGKQKGQPYAHQKEEFVLYVILRRLRHLILKKSPVLHNMKCWEFYEFVQKNHERYFQNTMKNNNKMIVDPPNSNTSMIPAPKHPQINAVNQNSLSSFGRGASDNLYYVQKDRSPFLDVGITNSDISVSGSLSVEDRTFLKYFERIVNEKGTRLAIIDCVFKLLGRFPEDELKKLYIQLFEHIDSHKIFDDEDAQDIMTRFQNVFLKINNDTFVPYFTIKNTIKLVFENVGDDLVASFGKRVCNSFFENLQHCLKRNMEIIEEEKELSKMNQMNVQTKFRSPQQKAITSTKKRSAHLITNGDESSNHVQPSKKKVKVKTKQNVQQNKNSIETVVLTPKVNYKKSSTRVEELPPSPKQSSSSRKSTTAKLTLSEIIDNIL